MKLFPVTDYSQRSLPLGVIAVLFGISLTSCWRETAPAPQSQTSATPGKAAAESNATLSGGSVLLGDVARIDSVIAQQPGHWILVNVWATWCRPCVAEMPDLVALHQSLQDKPFSLIGISADYMTSPTPEEAMKKVRNFGVQHKVLFPNIIFSGSLDDLTARFALGGTIPTSILYDPQGREVERWIGRLVEDDVARIKSLII